MHDKIAKKFEKLCSKRSIKGSVLEVGATPSNRTLLAQQFLEHSKEKVGINLEEVSEYKDFIIYKGNANDMEIFPDERFDTVFCNSVLEHDKYFWKTIAKLRRVTKTVGSIAIGTPGYTYLNIEKVKKVLRRLPIIRSLKSENFFNVFFEGMNDVEVGTTKNNRYWHKKIGRLCF